ncbi:unnamed protein product [Prunus armeniaca]
MFASRVSRIGVLILKQLSGGKPTAISRAGYNTSSCYNQYLQPLFDQQSETKLLRGAIFHKHHLFSTVCASDSSNEGIEQKEKISVTFVDKDGEEIHIKVPTGMSMLEAAHENDIDLEGACEGSLACSTCHVIVMDMELTVESSYRIWTITTN